MNDRTDVTEIDKLKSAQMAFMIAEGDTKMIEDWCLNAKENRSSTPNNFLFRLRAKLYKKAEEPDSQSRSRLETLLYKTEFYSSLTAV